MTTFIKWSQTRTQRYMKVVVEYKEVEILSMSPAYVLGL